MTPEEILTSPEEEVAEIPAEAAAEPAEAVIPETEIVTMPEVAEAAEELSQLLADPIPEVMPEPAEDPGAALPEMPPQPVREAPVQAAAPKKAKKIRRKPHIALRIPLQLLSFILSLALFVTALAGALVLDLQQLTSAGALKQLIDAVISTAVSATTNQAPAQPQLNKLSNWTIRLEEADASEPGEDIFTSYVDENGNVIIVDQDGNIISGGSSVIVDENGNVIFGDPEFDIGDLPEDFLTGDTTEENMDNLIDWFYDQVEQSNGGSMEVAKEQVKEFIEESTVSDYLSEKLAGFTEDFINGTENTVITTDEIMDLLEENEKLLESKLQLELTPEFKAEFRESVDKVVEESDINNVIREEVFGAVDEMLEQSSGELGFDMDELRSALQLLNSETMRNLVILVNVALILLLCLLNFYNVPAGLTWAAFPLIFSGAILQLPVMLLQSIQLPPEASSAVPSLLKSFTDVFNPIHSGVLYLGIGLLVISIIWRIIRASRRN